MTHLPTTTDPSSEVSDEPGAPQVAAEEDRRPARRYVPDAVVLVVFTLIGWTVVAPWTGRGWLLLLDWTPGPHARVPRSVFGLDGAVNATAPFHVTVHAVQALLGVATTSWFLILVMFPVAALGVSRLIGGPLIGRLAAGLAYTLSPIVYERLWAGQLAYVVAYACLPWAARAVIRATEGGWRRPLAAGVWIGVLVACGPHFGFICGLIAIGVVVRDRGSLKSVLAVGFVVVVAGVSSFYLVVGSTGRPASTAVSQQDLAVYRTTSDPRVGLYLNVAGQYGFWRQEARLPKDDVTGWPFILGAMVVVAGVGVVAAHRDPRRRPIVVPLLVAAALGFVLALGDQGPTGGIFTWLFRHVPGFAVMREPQKFACLVALATSSFFGLGAVSVWQGTRSRRGRHVVAALVLAAPVLYNPSMFFGLHHRMRLAHLPAAYAQADRLMGAGPGRVLVLPWHQYVAFPFTHSRVIANPFTTMFRRETIVGDNVEVGDIETSSQLDRSHFLEFLFKRASTVDDAGELLAPLGVEYVAVAKTADWQNYAWIDHQTDLRQVFDSPDLALYRNTAAAAPTVPVRSWSVRNWDELLQLARTEDIASDVIRVAEAKGGPVDPARTFEPDPLAPATAASVRQLSRTRYAAVGGAAPVIAPEPFDPAWRAGQVHAVEDGHGVIAFPQPVTRIAFGFWNRLRLAYLVSLVPLVIAVGLGVIDRFRSLREVDT